MAGSSGVGKTKCGRLLATVGVIEKSNSKHSLILYPSKSLRFVAIRNKFHIFDIRVMLHLLHYLISMLGHIAFSMLGHIAENVYLVYILSNW